MPYDSKELYEKAVKAIKDNNLVFIEDIIALLPCRKPTFYDHFPIGSDEMNNLKELLEQNKINLKVSMRKKWHESDNATLQMALYKLCSTNTEHRILNTNYTDQTTNGKDLNTAPTIVFIDNDEDKV